MKTRKIKIHVALLAACILSRGIVPASTISWTNTSGRNWSVPANWNPNQMPGTGDTAVITKSGLHRHPRRERQH